MGNGRQSFVLLLALFAPHGDAITWKQGDKTFRIDPIPKMKWQFGNDGTTKLAYKHELVMAGGQIVKIRPDANYSVYPSAKCEQRVSFVVQLDPPKELCPDNEKRHQLTCTVSITIDDGHVEVWYGLCLSKIGHASRKFDFPLNPMDIVYFNFEKLTMKVFMKKGDWGETFEMGRVDFVSQNNEYTTFTAFTAFLYEDACPSVQLKQVFFTDARRKKGIESQDPSWHKGKQLTTMAAIFSLTTAITCLILSTMYVWSISVPFITNRFYDVVLGIYKKKDVKGGGLATAAGDTKEPNSCKTAEDQSEDWETLGMKEDLFGEKGKNRAPMRPPPGYALPDYDAPYEDDPEPGLAPAAPASNEPLREEDAKGEMTPPTKTPPPAAEAAV